MVNLDKALAMLLDEAAKLDRRSAAQWLTVAIEDVRLNMPDDKFQMLWQRVESKIEATADETDRKILKDQANDILARLADMGPMLPGE